MSVYYQQHQNDQLDNTDESIISPTQALFPPDLYNTINQSAQLATSYASSQFSSLGRVPSLSPSSQGFLSAQSNGFSPHSSASPRSAFSGVTDDFLFNNTFTQDDLSMFFLQDNNNGQGQASQGEGSSKISVSQQQQHQQPSPLFNLPKNWAFPANQNIANPSMIQQSTEENYDLLNMQDQDYSQSLPNQSNLHISNNDANNMNNRRFSIVSTESYPVHVRNDFRNTTSAAEQARVAALEQFEELKRQQAIQAEQIMAIQRQQMQHHQNQGIDPSWMNMPSQPQQSVQPLQAWPVQNIKPPSLPTIQRKSLSAEVQRKPSKAKPPKPKDASPESASTPENQVGKHNKTERRYRQKVQAAQAQLRDSVPALRLLYGTSTDQQRVTTDFKAPDGTVDGLGEVSRPNASAKATILNGARLYIEVLQERVEMMSRKVAELEGYRMAVGGEQDLENWRNDFNARQSIRIAEDRRVKREAEELMEMDGSESESEDEAPKKRKKYTRKEKASSDNTGVRVFAAFAMSFSMVPSASTLLRHQSGEHITPGYVLSGEATPTQVISRLPLITAEHVHGLLTRLLPTSLVLSPGSMVDWTWRILVAAVLILVLGPILKQWRKIDEEEIRVGDIFEMTKDLAKLSVGLQDEEDERWDEYAAAVVGRSTIPGKLGRAHLVTRLNRTADKAYSMTLLSLLQPEMSFLKTPQSLWLQARSALVASDPPALQAVLALPFEEALQCLELLAPTSSPISAMAEQITLVYLNDLYSRLFIRLVDATTTQSVLPISIKALIANLEKKSLRADLSTFDTEIKNTIQGVPRGSTAYALGLVLIGLWGVFCNPAPSAQASLASALAGEEISCGLSSVSAMLELLYPGVSQPSVESGFGLSQNALALDKFALVCIGYVKLLSSFPTHGNLSKLQRLETSRHISKSTTELRMIISQTTFKGLELVDELEDGEVEESENREEKNSSLQMKGLEESKERLVSVLSLVGRRAMSRVCAKDEDSGADDVDEL